jgi:CBS domain-containing protein
MNVDKLMTKDVACCSADQSLSAAAHLMWEYDCGCIPIVDDNRHVVGMITDRDICMAACFQGKSLHEICVRDAMARQVLSCRPTNTVQQAEGMMQRAQIRRVPVTDDAGRLVGILSLNDIAREAEAQNENARDGRTDVGLDSVALTLSAVGQQHHAPPTSRSVPIDLRS